MMLRLMLKTQRKLSQETMYDENQVKKVTLEYVFIFGYFTIKKVEL